MKSVSLAIAIIVLLIASSCSGSAPLTFEDTDREVSATSADWAAAWNAQAGSFGFQTLSRWNPSLTFGSTYGGSNFSADAAAFAAAMASSMNYPGLPDPASSSTLGLWYDSLGDDLE
jgi:hypothetical protein